jgi:DNA polymerase-3 subunit epsilon
MREVVIDTETTGLDPDEGHRVVELGGLELVNHLPTGRIFHRYLDPERDMPVEAFKIHGLTREFLTGKARFAEIATDFESFIGADRIVMHNASFDLKFLNAELARCGRPLLAPARAVDTLELARRRFPGAQISLDALCRRFGIDLSERERHSALLDCRLLAAVYLELVGGREPALSFREAKGASLSQAQSAPQRPNALPARLSEAERQAHEAFLDSLPASALWRSLPSGR